MKSIEVKLDNKVVEVSKLPLKKYADLIVAIEELPKLIPSLSGKSFEEIITMLPLLISKAWPDFVRIISCATDLKPEEIEEMGLTEAVRVIEALIEVNDYRELFETIKKVLAQNRKA